MIYTGVMSGSLFGNNRKSGFYNDKGALEDNQINGMFGRANWFKATQYVCQNNVYKENKSFIYDNTLFYGETCNIASVLDRQVQTITNYVGGA